MTSVRRRGIAAAVALTTAALGLTAVAAVPAAAAESCTKSTSAVHWARTGNNLYLNSGTFDLAAVRAACPIAPISNTGDVWNVDVNLVVRGGARLNLWGPAAGGGTATVRLMSLPSGVSSEVVELTAVDGGVIDMRSTAVTSWTGTGPDTDVTVPAGEKMRGRAFVRAVSRMVDGVPRESRIDITGSDLGYLGYAGSEAYGVSYKARECGADAAGQKVCAVLDVLGDQRNSRFHHNYIGTYTWGALGMVFEGNEYADNISYGLDPHDDSDDLLISRNRSVRNGNHGIICSQRCDNLRIVDNVVADNGPRVFDKNRQVHGIMIHRGVTNTLVRGNTITGQQGGAIAVFDSFRNTIRDNTIRDSYYGFRLSVGSHHNVYENNTVTNSGANAVYAFRGTDAAGYGTANGRPQDELFRGNRFDGTKAEVVKLQSVDRFTFRDNVATGAAKPMTTKDSTGVVWEGTPPAITATGNSRVRVDGATARWAATVASGSVLDVTDRAGRLSQVTGGVPATVRPSGSTTRLAAAKRATVRWTVVPRALAITPNAASLAARPAAAGSTRKIVVTGGRPGVRTTYRVAGLTPRAKYRITVDRSVRTVRASAKGVVAWTLVERTGGTHRITVAPAPR